MLAGKARQPEPTEEAVKKTVPRAAVGALPGAPRPPARPPTAQPTGRQGRPAAQSGLIAKCCAPAASGTAELALKSLVWR